jgi:hypothetical protein
MAEKLVQGRLLKFTNELTFTMQKSSVLNMYHVFPLLKDAEKLEQISASCSHLSKNNKTWDSEGKETKK